MLLTIAQIRRLLSLKKFVLKYDKTLNIFEYLGAKLVHISTLKNNLSQIFAKLQVLFIQHIPILPNTSEYSF